MTTDGRASHALILAYSVFDHDYAVLLNSKIVNRYSLLTFGIIWSLSLTFTYPDDGRASEGGLNSTSSSHRNEFFSAVIVSPSST